MSRGIHDIINIKHSANDWHIVSDQQLIHYYYYYQKVQKLSDFRTIRSQINGRALARTFNSDETGRVQGGMAVDRTLNSDH